jgi:hypothetical protein
MRDELFTTKIVLENRAYFFNVKENRMGDVFLQIVESKSKNGEDFDRRAIVVFADDMQQFFAGLDESLVFIEKNKKTKTKAAPEKKIIRKKERIGENSHEPERTRPDVKRTGKVRIVTKKN